MLAVEELEQVPLILLEAVVAQADGVFQDVEGAALVALRLDLDVGAQAQFHLFAAFQVACGGHGRHVRSSPKLEPGERGA